MEEQYVLHICLCVFALKYIRAWKFDYVCLCGHVGLGVCACACSLTYPAYTAHASYCHLWPLAPPYFSTLSHKRCDFRKEAFADEMCFSTFCTTCIWKNLSFWGEYSEIFLYICRRTCYTQILMKLEFSGQSFEKNLSIKFYQNPSSGNRVVPYGWNGCSHIVILHIRI